MPLAKCWLDLRSLCVLHPSRQEQIQIIYFSAQVNRDVISNEMQRMRQQLSFLQAELCARGGEAQSDQILVPDFCQTQWRTCELVDSSSEYIKLLVLQVLKEKVAWLEASNEDLCRKLHEYRSRCAVIEQCEIDAQVFLYKQFSFIVFLISSFFPW